MVLFPPTNLSQGLRPPSSHAGAAGSSPVASSKWASLREPLWALVLRYENGELCLFVFTSRSSWRTKEHYVEALKTHSGTANVSYSFSLLGTIIIIIVVDVGIIDHLIFEASGLQLKQPKILRFFRNW